ncbi:PFAS [Mytilus coruscus]|uniref:PFAS n=1 Tax=Mytilus coruscus TaxID=42192 RepID=A0A6J8BF02_MYTCO|nr:PFAS [Mytilus coruscus]
MWPAKLPGEGAALLDACTAMCDVMKKLGIAVDGGKDSLSMAARVGDDTVKAPGTLVISVYAGCPDITATVTPDLKCPHSRGSLLYIDLSCGKHRLGGSSLAHCYGQLGNTSPDLDDPDMFVSAFNLTQGLIKDRKLVSGHDISDGGMITCLLEMSFAGNCGLDIDISCDSDVPFIDLLFAEELGFVFEVSKNNEQEILGAFSAVNIPCFFIGHSTKDTKKKSSVLFPEVDHQVCVGIPPIKVAVLREEGSNSDREMAALLHMAGFEVWDVNMQDMCSGKITLDQFRGVVFVGGFSYGDVCGSAKENVSSGVGQGVFLDHNDSGRFECRFVTVRVQSSPSIMFRGMEGTVFGMWSAHGEGKMIFKTPDIQNDVLRMNLAPVRYVDDSGNPTIVYPFNPNGSPDGIAALCSEDGRHLAIMPHPERCFLPWQCPWMPFGMKEKLDVSPWYKMFQNAFDWCVEQV